MEAEVAVTEAAKVQAAQEAEEAEVGAAAAEAEAAKAAAAAAAAALEGAVAAAEAAAEEAAVEELAEGGAGAEHVGSRGSFHGLFLPPHSSRCTKTRREGSSPPSRMVVRSPAARRAAWRETGSAPARL